MKHARKKVAFGLRTYWCAKLSCGCCIGKTIVAQTSKQLHKKVTVAAQQGRLEETAPAGDKCLIRSKDRHL